MATLPQKYEDVERWAFGDTEQVADELLALVLNGTKTATCAALDDEGFLRRVTYLSWLMAGISQHVR